MSGRIRDECYLLGPFSQPALVVTLPSQLRPEERVEVVNVQQGFLLDSLALALASESFNETITVATGGRC